MPEDWIEPKPGAALLTRCGRWIVRPGEPGTLLPDTIPATERPCATCLHLTRREPVETWANVRPGLSWHALIAIPPSGRPATGQSGKGRAMAQVEITRQAADEAWEAFRGAVREAQAAWEAWQTAAAAAEEARTEAETATVTPPLP